ncbi:CxxH/CxxC protein [Evansella sp. AB-rgal1]|uniref:CxxH/CxxC protein n=1 Tax=Evansella sp. AB-rgal1 TaxID=3242696 RepID=UPI00359CC870
MYSCEKHVEIALDEVIDEHEMPPEIELVQSQERISNRCSFCEEEAKYKISG